MSNKKILILPGDGIGNEVMSEVIKIINWMEKTKSVSFDISERLVGGTAYDKEGDSISDDTMEMAINSDAVLFGAVGGSKWDNVEREKRPEAALLRIRKELDLFANLRPAFLFDELLNASNIKPDVIKGFDIMIVRELTSGLYFGEPRGINLDQSPPNAFNTMYYNEDQIKRISKIAFELALKRTKKVCSVDKANVLEVSKFWRNVVAEVHSSDFEVCELSNMLADNAAMQLILNPNQFDVVLASNLFGDILSDIAATLTGSIGMLPSASLNDSLKGMYEPCHGSAPDIAGKGIANPIAMILSLAMALRYSLNFDELASQIEVAVKKYITAGFRTKDISIDGKFLTTNEATKKIISFLNE